MPSLTIFTPTYNRSHTLGVLYNSLINQTQLDFEWLIIDDGSTDETESVVIGFIKENRISIRYIKKQNGGKHTAWMVALEKAEGELFFCVDSDDSLTYDAVEKILESNRRYKEDSIIGFYYLQGHSDGRPNSPLFPKNITKSGICDLFYKYGFRGETAIVLRTEIARKAKFPVFENEKFVSERVYYNQLNDIGLMVLINDIIYISEYLEDGYTRNIKKTVLKSPKGHCYDCLSEAANAASFVYRAKKYAECLAYLKRFNIRSKSINYPKRIKLSTRIVGRFFSRHYVKILDKELNNIGDN